MKRSADWDVDNTRIHFPSPRADRFDIYRIDLIIPGGLDALRGKTVSAEIVEAQ